MTNITYLFIVYQHHRENRKKDTDFAITLFLFKKNL